jgi:heterodisulfide reductase subunit C
MRMIVTQARSLTDALLDDLRSVPDGDKLSQCLQCGTCTASCPSSHLMEYAPRSVVAAIRADMLDRVIDSNTVWMCASCYACAVRCPAGIPFTDIMYRIKQLGIARGLVGKRSRGAAMARAFVEVVEKYGRNAEGVLLNKYYTRTGLGRAFHHVPLGMRLLRRRRFEMRPHKIAGVRQLRAMMAALERAGTV